MWLLLILSALLWVRKNAEVTWQLHRLLGFEKGGVKKRLWTSSPLLGISQKVGIALYLHPLLGPREAKGLCSHF